MFSVVLISAFGHQIMSIIGGLTNNYMHQLDLMKYEDNFSKTQSIKSKLVFGNPELCPDPYISIVIPTYNRPDFLKTAIDSALNQINPVCNYEVVVVDNEFTSLKTSKTEELIMQYQNPKLLYYQTPEIRGMVNNWNRGVLLARAKWIAFLHDDDILLLDYINRIIQLISRRKDVAGITAFFYTFHEDSDIEQVDVRRLSSVKSKIYNKLSRNKLMRLYQLDSNIMLMDVYNAPTCGSIFRKECLIESGGFDDSLFPSFDWFFLYRFCKEYKLYRSMERLGYYRAFKNTSSLEETKNAFLRDRVMFADSVYQHTRLGRAMLFLFENELNNKILNTRFSDYTEKAATGYYEQEKLKERKFRKYAYNFIVNGYWLLKERFYLFFG